MIVHIPLYTNALQKYFYFHMYMYMSRCRNRTCEQFMYQVPELLLLDERKSYSSVLDVSPQVREIRAAKAHNTLHIPQATILRLKEGKIVDGVRRQYATFAGFKMSNDYPNNIALYKTAFAEHVVEVVYLEQFDVRLDTDTVVPLGRRFQTVCLMNICNTYFCA